MYIFSSGVELVDGVGWDDESCVVIAQDLQNCVILLGVGRARRVM